MFSASFRQGITTETSGARRSSASGAGRGALSGRLCSSSGGSDAGVAGWAPSHAVITRAEGGKWRVTMRRIARSEMLRGACAICLVYDCLFPYTVGGAERWYRNLAERLARRGPRGHLPDAAPVGARRAARRRPGVTRAWRRARGWRCTRSGGRRRILPPLVFGAGRALAPAAPRPPLRRRAHLRRSPTSRCSPRRCVRPLGALPAGRRLVRGVEPRLLARLPRRRRRARSARACSALCARVPQRAFCFSRAARRAPARGGPARRGDGAARACTPARSSRVPARAAEPARAVRRAADPGEAGAAGGRRDRARARERIDRPARRRFSATGPSARRCTRRSPSTALTGVVAAPGFVDAEHASTRALRRALCMLLPSRREGYGMVVVEAAARGTPSVVVAGEDNAATELIEEGVNGVRRRVAPSPRRSPTRSCACTRRGRRCASAPRAWFAEQRRAAVARALAARRCSTSYAPRERARVARERQRARCAPR